MQRITIYGTFIGNGFIISVNGKSYKIHFFCIIKKKVFFRKNWTDIEEKFLVSEYILISFRKKNLIAFIDENVIKGNNLSRGRYLVTGVGNFF